MLPTAQRAHPPHALNIDNIIQTRPARIPKHGALHMRGLELAALHENVARGGNGALRNVQAVVVVFAEAEGDGDAGGARGGADS